MKEDICNLLNHWIRDNFDLVLLGAKRAGYPMTEDFVITLKIDTSDITSEIQLNSNGIVQIDVERDTLALLKELITILSFSGDNRIDFNFRRELLRL